MKTIFLYVCDPDEVYLQRLNGYLLQREYSPFFVRTYTAPEAICKEENTPGILLIHEMFFDVVKEDPQNQFGSADWTNILFLCEEGEDDIRLRLQELGREPAAGVIEKYQSASGVYDRLIQLCAQRGETVIQRDAGQMENRPKMIGVYSPENKKLQYTCAKQLARQLADEQMEGARGLYMSFTELMPVVGQERGLSDLILWIKENVADTLPDAGAAADANLVPEEYVQKENGLDIILPAACPYDLKEITDEEWYQWLIRLFQTGNYTFLILEFGNSIPGLCLLELCQEIVMPVLDEDTQACRQVQDLLRFMGHGELAQRIRLQSAHIYG